MSPKKKTRAELEEIAKGLGIENPAGFKNKSELEAAIAELENIEVDEVKVPQVPENPDKPQKPEMGIPEQPEVPEPEIPKDILKAIAGIVGVRVELAEIRELVAQNNNLYDAPLGKIDAGRAWLGEVLGGLGREWNADDFEADADYQKRKYDFNLLGPKEAIAATKNALDKVIKDLYHIDTAKLFDLTLKHKSYRFDDRIKYVNMYIGNSITNLTEARFNLGYQLKDLS